MRFITHAEIGIGIVWIAASLLCCQHSPNPTLLLDKSDSLVARGPPLNSFSLVCGLSDSRSLVTSLS